MVEELYADGNTITRDVEIDPSIPLPGESTSQHALRGLKLIVDMHCADGDPQGAAKVAVAYFEDLEDPVDLAAAEDYVKLKTGMNKETLRAQFKEFKKRFSEPAPAKPPAVVSTGLHLTEMGNGQRFAAAFRGRFRWCEGWGRWLAWDEKRWATGSTLAVMTAGSTLPSIIDRESQAEEDVERRKALRKWANASERIHAVHSALEFAKPLLAVTPDQLDRDGWLLNVSNGTIDLRTGELKPHDKADLITKLAPVDYDKNALCSRWEQFLCEVFDNDMALIDYIGRLAGYCLTGDITEHIFPILWGQGRNGKSIFVDTLLGILGDYACKAPASLLVVQRNEEHPTEIAGLQGKRFVVGSENEQGAKLRMQLIKEMTGDAVLRGRFMRCDYFDFQRTFKLMLMTNHKPRIHDDSVAAWERVKLVPFTVQFLDGTDRPPDRNLLDKLKAEWPGILAWMVLGNITRLKDGGLPPPKAVKTATAEYRSDEDPLAGFIGEGAALDREVWTSVAELREAFEQVSELKWGRIVTERLKELGCISKPGRHNGKIVRGWKGIKLLDVR